MRIPSCLSVLFVLPAVVLGHERENTAIPPHQEDCHHSVAVATGWESRYFSEGRDALDGDALWMTSIDYMWESLSFGVWYGSSPEQSYDELQLGVAWHQSLSDDLDFYAGYTRYELPSDDEEDNEVGIGFAYTGLPQDIELALDAYHSFEADGFFVELSASREWELSDKLTASFTGIFGVNQGYVADGHDGANHIAASVGLSYALTESLTIGAHGTYSWGIDRKAGAADDASLKDFFHAGVGVEWSF